MDLARSLGINIEIEEAKLKEKVDQGMILEEQDNEIDSIESNSISKTLTPLGKI